MGFSRQENWSGLPFPSARDLPNPEVRPVSPAWAGSFYHEPLGEPVLHLVGASNLMMYTMVNFRMKMQCPGLPSIQWTKSSLLSCCSFVQSCPTFWKSDRVDSGIPCTVACQAPQTFTIFQSLLTLTSIESVMPSNHLILCHPHLLLPSIKVAVCLLFFLKAPS